MPIQLPISPEPIEPGTQLVSPKQQEEDLSPLKGVKIQLRENKSVNEKKRKQVEERAIAKSIDNFVNKKEFITRNNLIPTTDSFHPYELKEEIDVLGPRSSKTPAKKRTETSKNRDIPELKLKDRHKSALSPSNIIHMEAGPIDDPSPQSRAFQPSNKRMHPTKSCF